MTWLGSTNKAVTNGRQILGLVIHSSEGTLDAMTQVFNIPGGASAHYAIGTDGRRYQYVLDKDVAFQVAAFGNDPRLNRNRPNWLPAYNGLYSAVNACTLGVELEGFAAQGFTPPQYVELGRLIAEKSREHRFSPTLLVDAGPDARLLTHGWLQTDRSDPGVHFQWETLRTELLSALHTEGDDMDGIIDELNNQVAALRAEIDGLNGVNTELGRQVNSLQWLLSVSQGETAAQAAEVERLNALLSDGSASVQAVAVTLGGGRIETLTRT